MPKLSVIIPVYKAEKYLNRCVDSLLAQTLDDIQIILVDDGSPDRSGEICDAYVCKPVGGGGILVIHKENGGVSSARNAGLDVATGEYIAFVDADDEINDKNAYKTLYGKAKKSNADIIIYGFQYQSPSETKRIVPVDDDVLYGRIEFMNWFARERAIGRIAGSIDCTCAKWFKKSTVEGVKYNSKFEVHEDALYSMEAYEKAEKYLLVASTPYTYFFNEGSATSGGVDYVKYIGYKLGFNEAMRSFYERNHLSDKYKSIFSAFIVSRCIFMAVDNIDPFDPICKRIKKAIRVEYLFHMLHSLTAFAFMFFFWIGQPHLIWKIQKIRGKMKK